MRELRGDWRDLFNNFAIALDPRKMFLGLFGIIMTCALLTVYFWLWDLGLGLKFFEAPVELLKFPAFFNTAVLTILTTTTKLKGLLLLIMFYSGIILIVVFVWSYFGGAITRIASVEIAKDERMELGSALHYSKKKYSSFFWSELTCMFIFLFFFLCIFAVCLLARIPFAGAYLKIVMMLFLFLAFLASFLMTMVAIGATFGHVLFYPAISAEGTDAFDAISRGFSYLYSQPWRYIWHQAVSAVYGAITFIFVFLFANIIVHFMLVAARLGMGKDSFSWTFKYVYNIFQDVFPQSFQNIFGPLLNKMDFVKETTLSTPELIATVIFTAWVIIFYGFVLSFIISYFYSSQTMIYFLLRKKVDNIEMNEVYEEETSEDVLEETPAPAPQPVEPPKQEEKKEG